MVPCVFSDSVDNLTSSCKIRVLALLANCLSISLINRFWNRVCRSPFIPPNFGVGDWVGAASEVPSTLCCDSTGPASIEGSFFGSDSTSGVFLLPRKSARFWIPVPTLTRRHLFVFHNSLPSFKANGDGLLCVTPPSTCHSGGNGTVTQAGGK